MRPRHQQQEQCPSLHLNLVSLPRKLISQPPRVNLPLLLRLSAMLAARDAVVAAVVADAAVLPHGPPRR